MSSWIVHFDLPWEVGKEERLKNAIEEFNNRNLNGDSNEREIKQIFNK